ncbi:MAG: hypothetical protein IPP78_09935 [Holophagaceae bacterium]|nr:hypothetical protein [Holophagaceae bacterium]
MNAGAWTLTIPAEGNELLEGGAFAVLVPGSLWAWVSGTATIPAGTARILASKVGMQALVGRNLLLSPLSPSSLLNRFSNMDGQGTESKTKSLSKNKNKNLLNRDEGGEGDHEKTKLIRSSCSQPRA